MTTTKAARRPSFFRRLGRCLRGKKVNRGIADNLLSVLFLLVVEVIAVPLFYFFFLTTTTPSEVVCTSISA